VESVAHLSIRPASLQLGLSERSDALNHACRVLGLAASFKDYARSVHGAYGVTELRDVCEETRRLFGTLTPDSSDDHKADVHFAIEGVAHLPRKEAARALGLPQRGTQLDRACQVLGADSFREFVLMVRGAYGARNLQTLPHEPPAPAAPSTAGAGARAGAPAGAQDRWAEEAAVGDAELCVGSDECLCGSERSRAARHLFGTLTEASSAEHKARVRVRLAQVSHLPRWEALIELHLPWRGVQLDRACAVLGARSWDHFCACASPEALAARAAPAARAARAGRSVEMMRLFVTLKPTSSARHKAEVLKRLQAVVHLKTAPAAAAELGLPADGVALNKICRALGAASFEHFAREDRHNREVRAFAREARSWLREGAQLAR
jgi:hypothetical protein